MPLSGPTMIRRQLGRRLRALRQAARKTEADVEEANLASRVKLWRIETGKVGVKIGDVRGLCWLYDADQATTDALSLLAGASNHVGYWEDQHGLPAELWLFTGLELMADEIRAYESDRVPDLLQTADYMRGLRLAIEPTETEHGLQEWTKLRVERQEMVLARTAPPRLTVVLNAGALTRPVGNTEVMAGQVARLHELNRSDCIDIRVLPWETGTHPAMRAGGFTIFDFRHDDDPAVAYAPTLTGARYAETADEVGEYRRIFRQLYDKTVPIEIDGNLWAWGAGVPQGRVAIASAYSISLPQRCTCGPTCIRDEADNLPSLPPCKNHPRTAGGAECSVASSPGDATGNRRPGREGLDDAIRPRV